MTSRSDLLIQATPELLDGWYGPVLVEYAKRTNGHTLLLECVTLRGEPAARGGWVVLGVRGTRLESPAIKQPIDRVYLDLSRAECRDRLARALAATLNQAVGCTAPGWRPMSFAAGYGLRGSGDTYWYDWHDFSCDPSDDTRLPDGSRLVDAIALAAVWRKRLTSKVYIPF